ncbi:hypothetical protein BH23BAC3_BH23BAC3_30250 [soil metagenome]
MNHPEFIFLTHKVLDINIQKLPLKKVRQVDGVEIFLLLLCFLLILNIFGTLRFGTLCIDEHDSLHNQSLQNVFHTAQIFLFKSASDSFPLH